MRRRADQSWVPWREYDALDDVPPYILQYIGAILLAWNFIEDRLDDVFCRSIRCATELDRQISSRINGIDGKIEIVKKALNLFPIFTPEEVIELKETLGAIQTYKGIRDAIAHLRLPSPESPVGYSHARRGMPQEVLINVGSLSTLYAHLDELAEEVTWLYRLIERCAITQDEIDDHDYLAPPGIRSGSEFQDGFAQFRLHRSQRQSLPPLPQFPEEPEALLRREGHQDNQG